MTLEPLAALLLHDLEHETATMMLADIMFRSNDFDEVSPSTSNTVADSGILVDEFPQPLKA